MALGWLAEMCHYGTNMAVESIESRVRCRSGGAGLSASELDLLSAATLTSDAGAVAWWRWALRRRGITPEWRALCCRRTCRNRNQRPTASVGERATSARRFITDQQRFITDQQRFNTDQRHG